MWEYLKHLSSSESCRKEVGVDIEFLSARLKEIEDEWDKQNPPPKFTLPKSPLSLM
jgi:hypothetical protein